MKKQSGATKTKRCQEQMVMSPVKIMYINMVMPRQWYNVVLKRTLFLLFSFLLIIVLIIIIIATLKSNFTSRVFELKVKVIVYFI